MQIIYAVSDATGSTAEGVVRAALTQFEQAQVVIERRGGLRDPEQLRHLVAEAAQSGGMIVHTLVSDDLRRLALTEGRAVNVTTIDLMGPLLVRLSEILQLQPSSQPGLFHPFDSAYMDRVEAIDYTVRHDDGKNVSDLNQAEIVLVGVSRTSKTPLSIYLAYRGWRVANVPIVLGMEPPAGLFELPRHRVVGLVLKPERLVELRHVRAARMGIPALGYADLEHIRQEVTYAYQIYERRRDWPLVDVTSKPIEEAAAEVLALIGSVDQDPV
jgi:regulator of PEP synthase PpsR (kinase-PPPase family)